MRIHTANAKRWGFLIRRLGSRLLARRRELPNEPRIDAERDQQEAARLGVTTAELPPFNSEGNIYPINKARGKVKGKGQGDPGVAMAYMRRLHGDPDYAPVADLADMAESEQTTAGMKKENNNNRRQSQ